MSEAVSRKQKAHILIRVEPGKEVDLYNELRQIPNVAGIDLVRGPFDFIVVAEGTGGDVERVILQIRRLRYILSTETLTSFETYPWEDVSGRLDYGHL